MSLEGNLTAFGLSEILQLIAVQQKSGMLSITSQDRSKVLFFRDGNVISTRDRRRNTRDPLKDFLTRYGVISRQELLRLTHISGEARLDLTDIIVSEGVMTEEQMKKHFRDHIQEETHEVLTWEQCSYKFIPGLDIIEGIKTWGEFNIEGMLMESMRRIDEFPQALELLPNLGALIQRAGPVGEDAELTQNEVAVYQLLDRERTLSYLIGHAKIPQYETYEAIKHLHEKNIVAVTVDDTAETTGSEAEVQMRSRRKRKRRNVLPFMASFLLFALALAWGANRTIPQIGAVISGTTITPDAGSLTRNRVEATLRWTLEAYYAKKGHYPSQLARLGDDGLASKAFMEKVDRYGFRYHLTAEGDRYTLL